MNEKLKEMTRLTNELMTESYRIRNFQRTLPEGPFTDETRNVFLNNNLKMNAIEVCKFKLSECLDYSYEEQKKILKDFLIKEIKTRSPNSPYIPYFKNIIEEFC